jgi:CHASE1-domain containing sensor protein
MFLILCTGLMLTAFFYRSHRNAAHQQAQLALEAIALEELVVIREELASQFDLVKAVGIYASEHDMSSPEQFQEFCRPLIASHSSIKALSWAAWIPDSMRTNFEATGLFSEMDRPFIYERSKSGMPIPASERAHYVPVQFIVPWSDNKQAVGFDLASEQTRLDALQRAEQHNDLAITGPLQLVQDKEPVEAFLAFYPVWKETKQESFTSSPDPMAQRRPPLKGFASGVFHTADVIEPCLKFARSHLWIRINDVTDGKKVVYSMPELRQDSMGSNPPLLILADSFENVGRIWEIEFFVPHHRQMEANWVGLDRIIVGILLTSVLAGSPLFLGRLLRSIRNKHEAKRLSS